MLSNAEFERRHLSEVAAIPSPRLVAKYSSATKKWWGHADDADGWTIRSVGPFKHRADALAAIRDDYARKLAEAFRSGEGVAT